MGVTVVQRIGNGLLHRRTDSRSNAGKEENIDAGEQGFPVKFSCTGFCQGTSGPVVENACWTDIISLFKVINAKARAAPQDTGGIYTVAAQLVKCGIANRIVWQLGQKSGIIPEGQLRYRKNDYGIDLLVPDLFVFAENFPNVPCDRMSIDDYLSLTLKGGVR